MADTKAKVEKVENTEDKEARYGLRKLGKLVRVILDEMAERGWGTEFVKDIEKKSGIDLDGDGKVGSARLIAVVMVAAAMLVAGIAMAEAYRADFMVEGTYGTARVEGDSTTLQGVLTADDIVAEDDMTVGDDLAVGGEISSAGSGTKGALVAAGIGTMTAVEYVYGNLHNVTITCTAMGYTMLDQVDTTGHGGTNIYTCAEGLILSLGAVIDGSITGAGDAYQAANWGGDIALGTTLVDNTATPMVTTQQDILQNTAIAAATAQVAVCDAVSYCTTLTESAALHHDGTATAMPVYFNTLIDETADNEDDGTNTFTGTIEFTYLVIGDN